MQNTSPITRSESEQGMVWKNVQEIKEGDLVDMKSCPYMNGHRMADMLYAEVTHVEQETPDCFVVGYDGIDDFGYPNDTRLKVIPSEEE